jgi:chromosome segregation ATPase
MESRPCIDDLKNKETIIDLEMKIAKIEVKLDHVKLNKESVLKSIESKDNIISNAKKSEIESQNFETLENDLDQLEKQLKKN